VVANFGSSPKINKNGGLYPAFEKTGIGPLKIQKFINLFVIRIFVFNVGKKFIE